MTGSQLRRRLRIRRGPGTWYRRLRSIEYLATRDRRDAMAFILADDVPLPIRSRLGLIRRYITITNQLRGYHTLGEMLAISRAILQRPSPVVVEAGCAHGSSSAKLSLATAAAGGRLEVFDSFRGIPPNQEVHQHLNGRQTRFYAGAFRATLSSVERTIARFGDPSVCVLHKGWFADTLPAQAPEAIDVAVLDVDLIESTRTCIQVLFPRLRPGGILFSLDGQLRATHQLLADPSFWRDQVGTPPPSIAGLGRSKLLAIHADPAPPA